MSDVMCDKCRPKIVVVAMWSEVVGEPELGVWCGWCLLPSAVRVKIAVGVEGTLDGCVTQVTQCGECLSIMTEPVELIDNR